MISSRPVPRLNQVEEQKLEAPALANATGYREISRMEADQTDGNFLLPSSQQIQEYIDSHMKSKFIDISSLIIERDMVEVESGQEDLVD